MSKNFNFTFPNNRRNIMSTTRSFILAVSISLAMAITFSCSSDDGNSTPSSGEQRGQFGYCDYGPITQYGGGCFEMQNEDDCDWEWGKLVSSCENVPPQSSSSYRSSSSLSTLPSSSSVAPSSSSVALSSSYIPSSSSLVPSSSSSVGYGSVSHGGQTYKTVVIGTQTWMAENLNYDPGTGNSSCYGNQASYCPVYGRLYDWVTAMGLPSSCGTNNCASQIQAKHQGVCPVGWHIPSEVDWDVLLTAVGGSGIAGTKLKAASGWNNTRDGLNGNGTDDYGFSALPGGYRFYNSVETVYQNIRSDGYWWSAFESSSTLAYIKRMTSEDFPNENHSAKVTNVTTWQVSKDNSRQYSVRCVKD